MGRLYGAAASAGDPLAGAIGGGVVVFGEPQRWNGRIRAKNYDGMEGQQD